MFILMFWLENVRNTVVPQFPNVVRSRRSLKFWNVRKQGSSADSWASGWSTPLKVPEGVWGFRAEVVPINNNDGFDQSANPLPSSSHFWWRRWQSSGGGGIDGGCGVSFGLAARRAVGAGLDKGTRGHYGVLWAILQYLPLVVILFLQGNFPFLTLFLQGTYSFFYTLTYKWILKGHIYKGNRVFCFR